MKNYLFIPKYVKMLDRISIAVFVGLCLLCFTLNGCTKDDNPNDTRGKLTAADNIEFVPNIDETVIDEPEELEESDPIDYESDAAATKVISVLGAKDNYQHSGCDTSTNKYKNYYIGGSQFELELTFDKPDTIVSIENPTGFYQMTVDEVYSPTSVRAVLIGNPTPQYKARNIKWTITWQNGKKRNFYMKMIPYFGAGNLYGSCEYHVRYTQWQARPDIYNLSQPMPSLANGQTIDANYTPTFLDIIYYPNGHFGVISNTPVQKSTLINGVRRNVWVFKVRDRNINCDYKAKTKTVKWFPSMKIPSTTGTRDSSVTFHRSY